MWSAGHSLNNRFFWALQTCDWDYNFNCGLLFLNLIPAFYGLGLDSGAIAIRSATENLTNRYGTVADCGKFS